MSGIRLIGCLAAVLVITTGCSSTGQPADKTVSLPHASPLPRASGAASATGRGFCKVDLPANWKKALDEGAISTDGEERLLVKGAGDGGRKIFAEVHSNKKGSLVLLSAGQRRVITEFSDPARQQILGAAFDGRWLVFGMGYSPENTGVGAVFVWDETKNDAPHMIVDSRAGTKSLPVSPVVRDGKASWIEEDPGPQRHARVHLYDLTSGHDETVHEGTAHDVTTFDDMLVWREGNDGEGSAIKTVSWTSGNPVETPSPLSQAKAPFFLSGSDEAVVWAASGNRSLLFWKKGWDVAQEVLADDQFQWPTTGGDLVSWGNGQATFVGDLRSKSYVQITPLLGSANIWNRALVMSFVSEQNPTRGLARTSVVSVDALPPLPGCEQK